MMIIISPFIAKLKFGYMLINKYTEWLDRNFEK
jgi:hypothetical protein